MVTEGLPASCNTCYDDPTPVLDARPQSSASSEAASALTPTATTGLADAFRDLSMGSRNPSVAATDSQNQPQRPALRSPTNGIAAGLDTPPGSPRQLHQLPRLDSNFRRTYDDNVTKKQGPCDNCAMTLPRRSTTPSNSVDTAGTRNPTLRTRAPAERVFGAGGQQSPPNSQTSSDTDGEREAPRRPRNRKIVEVTSSRTTSCSSASTTSETTPFHVHYVDYTSTHEPVSANSFPLLRASCLRTLSFETLPRAPTTAPPTSPHPTIAPSFVTTQSAGSAVSGGPIFFGDSLAGYTTAYIFRIPDIHARGHKRIYAFIALSTHKERLAMKTFAIISAAFRELATWIQQLAEAEAERAAESNPVSSVFYSGGGGGITQSTASAFDPPTASDRGSSFLTAGKGLTRRMGGGGGGASAPKARGLAEIVGQPDFFIELHRKFVQLLFEVGVTLNS